jgi:hypothetical protein
MTAPIFFNVRQARDRLLKEGEVLTIRRSRSTGRTVAYRGSYYERKRICAVLVERVATYYGPDDPGGVLSANLEGSGFLTVDEWTAQAAEGSDAIYRVRRLGP